jgi:hypothetical protein
MGSISVSGPIAGFNALTLVDSPVTNSQPTTTTVTAHATANTKGTWTEIIASTSAAATWVQVHVDSTFVSGNDTSMLLDIGIGAAASETVLIPNIGCGFRGTAFTGNIYNNSGSDWFFPLSVAAGSRLSARAQSAKAAGATALVHISLWSSGGGISGSAIDAIGANTATSRGVDVVAGLSNVEGDWTEITSSTSNDYRALLWAIQGAGDSGLLAGQLLLDIGKGGSGSETVILSNRPNVLGTSETLAPNPGAFLPVLASLPSGTRLAARAQFDSASAQSVDVILYGVR